MKTKNIENYLNSFGKQVVNRAKGGLQKKKGGGTNLEKSIKFKVTENAEGFSVQFFMANYGVYVDKGVSGTKQKRTYKDLDNKTVTSPFKYTNKQPPSGVLDKWVVRKGIAPRDKKGRFINRKSLVFLIARSIKSKGIQGLSFFQKPLRLGMKELNMKLLGAVKADIIESINTVE
tara:strand:+ start:47 stop:571 length:525 start_codon:yes stop_codon:yes gene_type:complete